jgi:hypothetical protein
MCISFEKKKSNFVTFYFMLISFSTNTDLVDKFDNRYISVWYNYVCGIEQTYTLILQFHLNKQIKYPHVLFTVSE